MKNINKSKFHKEFSPEKRKLEANRIIAKYPSRIPAIVQILETSNLPDLIKKKYLLPNDLSIGQFIYIIRIIFLNSSTVFDDAFLTSLIDSGFAEVSLFLIFIQRAK